MKRAHVIEILEKLEVDISHERQDGWITCHCPFAEWTHKDGRDDDPDMTVKVEPGGKSGFNCFACHEHGSMVKLVKRLAHYRGEDYNLLALKANAYELPDSFEDYERDVVVRATPEPLDKVAYMTMYIPAWENDRARAYLKKRGIGRKTAEKLELLYDSEEARVLFPVFDFKHDLYGFSGRSIQSDDELDAVNARRKERGIKHMMRPHRDYSFYKDHFVLGEHLINPDLPNAIFEGLFAYATLHEIGAADHVNVLATMGSSLSLTQRSILVEHNLPCYWFYDPDESGDKGLFGVYDEEKKGFRGNGALDKCAAHVLCYVPTWPKHLQDPDQFREYGLPALFKMMDGAKLYKPRTATPKS